MHILSRTTENKLFFYFLIFQFFFDDFDFLLFYFLNFLLKSNFNFKDRHIIYIFLIPLGHWTESRRNTRLRVDALERNRRKIRDSGLMLSNGVVGRYKTLG